MFSQSESESSLSESAKWPGDTSQRSASLWEQLLLLSMARWSVSCSSCDFSGLLPSAPDFFSSCVLMCLLRWSLRMKRFPHSLHPKRFSPVCVRRWRWSSSERVKLLPQKSQLQTNGRSPACHLRCAFRWDVFPYTLPHPGRWHICCFLFAGMLELVEFRQLGQRQRRHRRAVAIRGFPAPNRPPTCGLRVTSAGDGWFRISPFPPGDRASGLFPALERTLHHGASDAGGGLSCLFPIGGLRPGGLQVLGFTGRPPCPAAWMLRGIAFVTGAGRTSAGLWRTGWCKGCGALTELSNNFVCCIRNSRYAAAACACAKEISWEYDKLGLVETGVEGGCPRRTICEYDVSSDSRTGRGTCGWPAWDQDRGMSWGDIGDAGDTRPDFVAACSSSMSDGAVPRWWVHGSTVNGLGRSRWGCKMGPGNGVWFWKKIRENLVKNWQNDACNKHVLTWSNILFFVLLCHTKFSFYTIIRRW